MYFLLGSDKIAHNLVFIPLWCTEFYYLVYYAMPIYTQLPIIVHTQRSKHKYVCAFVYIYALIRSMHFGIMENSKRSVPCFLPQAQVQAHSFVDRSYLPDIVCVKHD